MMPQRLRLVVFALLVAAAGCSRSGTYPDRPITLICPWATGGGTDRVSRQVAVFLERDLGVPVNVVNATGGQGVTGHARGLQSRPDGYTLTMMTLELNMLHWRQLTKLTWQDCEPLMSVNEDPAAIFVRKDSPYQTVAELQAVATSDPGRLKASGTSALAAWHLALAGWLISQKLEPDSIVWIQSQGSAPALQELMSGGLDLVCCSLPEARSLLESGDIRCLGVMASQRMALPVFAPYPTLKEQGSDWTLTGWRGIGVPKGTPVEIQDRLKASLRRMVAGETQVNGETFPDFMDRQGFDHTWREGADFASFLKQSDEEFGRIFQQPDFATFNGGPIGPMVFPVLAGVLLLSSLGLMIGAPRSSATQAVRADTSSATTSSCGANAGRWNFALAIAAVAFYALASDSLGFLVTTGLILLTVTWRLRAGLLATLLLTCAAPPLFYLLFAGLLRVSLPVGVLGW